MSIKLPKIIRRDARVLQAMGGDDFQFYYEDIRPSMPGGRRNA